MRQILSSDDDMQAWCLRSDRVRTFVLGSDQRLMLGERVRAIEQSSGCAVVVKPATDGWSLLDSKATWGSADLYRSEALFRLYYKILIRSISVSPFC